MTKRIHNGLYGTRGDGGELGADERRHYEAVLRRNADELLALVRPGDVVLVYGLLLADPGDLASFGAMVETLLRNRDEAGRLGADARLLAGEVLGDRHLAQYGACSSSSPEPPGTGIPAAPEGCSRADVPQRPRWRAGRITRRSVQGKRPVAEEEARPRRKEKDMRKAFELGGVIAAVVLIAFGITAIVLGVNGRSTVNTSLKQEQITGTPDMTPTAIAGEVAAAKAAQTKLVAKLRTAGAKITPSPIETPSCSVAGKLVNSGDRARCFARYMRIHTFGATSGLTYAQMGRFTAKPGTPPQYTDGLGGTSDPKYALVDTKTQQPVSNGRRDIWVTYTALTTALNSSYMASQLALFGIVVGVALLLTGIGFAILAIGGALRSPDTALRFLRKWTRRPPEAAKV